MTTLLVLEKGKTDENQRRKATGASCVLTQLPASYRKNWA